MSFEDPKRLRDSINAIDQEIASYHYCCSSEWGSRPSYDIILDMKSSTEGRYLATFMIIKLENRKKQY